jgi:glycosyltransferase involved in cell wall biosynthesis
MPSITVVIPSYRYGHLVAGAIESVIGQTDHIIVCDDGVGDCEHVPDIYPEVQYIRREQNMGIEDNFQDLLERVETERVLFLGGDNELQHDALKVLDVDGDIVTYDIHVVGEYADEILRRHPDECVPYLGGYWWKREHKHHGSMLYNVELAKKSGGYKNPETYEDLALWERMRAHGATVAYIPEPLLKYRRHRENYNVCTR